MSQAGRSARDLHPFANAAPPPPPATAPARSEAGVMLSDYMARMEIIPKGDSRGGGSRGGSRAASRATSAGSDNFVVVRHHTTQWPADTRGDLWLSAIKL